MLTYIWLEEFNCDENVLNPENKSIAINFTMKLVFSGNFKFVVLWEYIKTNNFYNTISLLLLRKTMALQRCLIRKSIKLQRAQWK